MGFFLCTEIGSIGLIGMALGAVLAGTIADRIGRKQVFTITVLLYSISTGLCAVAWNYESLLVFRFLLTWGGPIEEEMRRVSLYAKKLA